MYNFIGRPLLNNVEMSLPKLFEILPKFLANQNLVSALAPPAPTPLLSPTCFRNL